MLRLLFTVLLVGWIVRVVLRLVGPLLALRKKRDPKPRAKASAEQPTDELAGADIEEAEYEELP